MTSYHFGKTVVWYNLSPYYKEKHVHFRDGSVHMVVYNNEMKWISSIYVDIKRRTHENVDYIDEKGEVVTGVPHVVIDVCGNEREILAIV